ncbi:hypothetical protein [Streptomyces sp. NPDC053728]|uniref:hypothetical protein n=1 Tax=unclassified Streptomyces TaxID=2593676 RepID=UPI0034312447
MLRRAAAAAVLVAGVLAPGLAYADDGPALGTSPGCWGSLLSVTVCAPDTTAGTPGTDA